MDATYIEYDFVVEPRDPATEIIVAELGSRGFESFVENESGVTAYIQKQDWKDNLLEDIHILNTPEFSITYSKQEVKQTNWNKEWEKNFQPIEVDGKVSIRAPFHQDVALPYTIVIEPKMSFGTGHHETTYMMIQHLLAIDIKNKSVLDMGCGTGILAIFSEMRGAANIDAIDIDTWCYENSLENVQKNGCENIKVYEGDATLLGEKKYDLIIANINRNILLNDMKTYTNCLNDKGDLLLSGFYEEDILLINEEVSKYGLSLCETIKKNKWVALRYQK